MTEKPQKPAYWLHTLYMEGGQSQTKVTASKRHPFGISGEDYSECYPITSEPLIRMFPKVKRPKVIV